MVLSQGLLGRKQAAIEAKERFKDDPEAVEFLDCAIETIDAVLTWQSATLQRRSK